MPKRRGARLLVALALVWCTALLAAHCLVAGLCDFDSGGCASTTDKNGLYRGVLVDQLGRPRVNTSFNVDFPFTLNPPVGGFSTDAAGRYCIVWSDVWSDVSTLLPVQYVAGGEEARPSGPWQPLNGHAAPSGCQRGNQSIRWWMSKNARGSPQYLLVVALLITSLFTLLGGLAASAVRFRQAGFALTAFSTAVAALVWFG
ncbi:MAG TPA: hypothetical protein VIJ51_04475 [Solirubrobacteraceae bacterium]